MHQHLLDRCTFPAAGTSVSCAVSGGADSLALMVLAIEAGCEVTAIHVDHGLRTGSHLEADVVAAAAERFGAEFLALVVDVDGSENVEANARAARFAALPEGVLTGHTADDQAETVLINLMRGAGLDGLAGMDTAGHPILGLRRHETHELCAELELEPVVDPSNDDPAFVRNRVRQELIPLLDEIAGRDVAAIIARQSGVIRDEVELLDMLSAAVEPTDAKLIASIPAPLARRSLRNWLKVGLDNESHPPDQASVERVLEVARKNAAATQISGGATVKRTGMKLRVTRGG